MGVLSINTTVIPTVMDGHGKRVISIGYRMDKCEVKFELLGVWWTTVITFQSTL